MNTEQRLILPTKLNPNKSTIYTNLREKPLKKLNLIINRAKTKRSRITNEIRDNGPEKEKPLDILVRYIVAVFRIYNRKI
jgi:hypothetical protein